MLRGKTIWLAAAVIVLGSLGAHAQTEPSLPATASAAAGVRAPGLYWTFQTDMGAIACSLYEKEAPITVGKMVGLAIGKVSYVDPRTRATVRKKFFDGLTFHRVIPNFMIQGGDPLGTGAGGPEGPGFPYKNETAPTLKFDVPGRLAMANAGPDTNASQFFITEVPYPSLDGNYTLWGQCDNVDVVRAIARVRTGANNRPVTPVRIQRVIIERVGSAPANAPEAMPVQRTPSRAPARATSPTRTPTGSGTSAPPRPSGNSAK